MNKYQKALNNLKILDYEDLYDDRDLEWCETLQELVDKETPKKPIEKFISDGYDEQGTFKNKIIQCPNCEFELYNEYECIDYTFNYCPKCGQRIDWSDEKW